MELLIIGILILLNGFFALSEIAIKIAHPIYFISTLFYPVVKFLSFSTSLINRLIGIKGHREQVTEAELRQMIKIASRDGVLKRKF